MNAYVLITCAIFGLITAAHVTRIVVEGAHVAKDPVFVVLTVAAAALCFWGGRLLAAADRSPKA